MGLSPDSRVYKTPPIIFLTKFYHLGRNLKATPMRLYYTLSHTNRK